MLYQIQTQTVIMNHNDVVIWFCLLIALFSAVGAWYCIATLESETEFPCLRDSKDDKYYQAKREGLRKE